MKKSMNNKVIRKVKEKPSWDNTVSDLNIHKLTPEELLQRKIDHISKNQQINFKDDYKNTPKIESVYDRLTKIRYGNQMKENDINNRKKIISNMFTSDKELYDLFEQSEKTLSTVESMFGDPLKRYKVKPTLTPAPNLIDTKKSNTNNNNCHALNECQDSDDESSKSECKSLGTASVDKDDDLSKFRAFIENERKVESAHENRRNVKASKTLLEAKKMFDVSTETMSNDELNSVLEYSYSILTDSNLSCPASTISPHTKDVTDKIINHLLNLNRKNTIKIDLLNDELNKNKELIDALTLELINNNEHMKRMKSELDVFSKNVTSELSGMKSLLIKYLDERVNIHVSTPRILANEIVTSSSSSSKTPRSRENAIVDLDVGSHRNEEALFKQQLNCLQIEHKEAQKRLKNLLKIQDSI